MDPQTRTIPGPWVKRPLPVAATALWAGVILGRLRPEVWPLEPEWTLWAAVAGLVSLWLFLLRRGSRSRLLLPLAVFFLTGLGLILPFQRPPAEFPPDHLVHLRGKSVVVGGTVVEPPRRREWGTYLTVEAESVLVPDRKRGERVERPVRGRLRLLLRSGGKPWPALAYGSRIRAQLRLKPIFDFANRPPGGHLFSYRRYLADRSVHLRASLKNPAALMVLDRSGGSALWRAVENRRTGARRLIEKAVDPSTAGLLRAILLGDREGLEKECLEAFQKTGTAHLLVVSGLHLTMIALLAGLLFRFVLTRWSGLCLRTNVILLGRFAALLPVLGYALLSGLSIPTWRAFILVAAAWSALAVSRKMDGPSALALAGLIVTLIWPPAIFDTGFQLSFMAVAVLMALGSAFQERLRPESPAGSKERKSRPARLAGRGWNHLTGLAVSSVLMGLFLAPLLALTFGRVPLAGVVLNMVLIPLFTLLAVPLGLLGLVASLVHPLPGGWLLELSGMAARAGAALVVRAADFDWASLRVTGLTVTEVVLIYAALTGAALSALRKRRKLGLLLLAGGLVFLAGDGLYWHHRAHNSDLVAEVLDVGQGTSILLRLPGGEKWLIDGGYRSAGGFDVGRLAVAPALWSRKINRVETVVASHPDADHSGGLGYIVSEFNPRRFIRPGHESSSPVYADLLEKVERQGISGLPLDRLRQGLKENSVEFRVLWPPPDFWKRSGRPAWYRESNETSLVLKVTHDRVRFLFTSDIEDRAEKELCRLHDKGLLDLSAEILYLAHHGGRTSTGQGFLERVGPELAVASCGAGSVERPHPQVRARLRRAGVRVLATRAWGAITITSDGRGYKVGTALARRR